MVLRNSTFVQFNDRLCLLERHERIIYLTWFIELLGPSVLVMPDETSNVVADRAVKVRCDSFVDKLKHLFANGNVHCFSHNFMGILFGLREKEISRFCGKSLSCNDLRRIGKFLFQAFSPLFQGVGEKVNCLNLLILRH